jgi:hypothetical protein
MKSIKIYTPDAVVKEGSKLEVECLLMHNHESYGDFEVVKVLIIPKSVAKTFPELLKEYLLTRRVCYRTRHEYGAHHKVATYYWFFSKEEVSSNGHLLRTENESVLMDPQDIPDSAFTTESVYKDEGFYKFLSDNGILVMEPVYAG